MAYFDRFSLAQRSLIPALLGFVFYGVWAFFVNMMHGESAAFKAGLVQGSYSFMVTLVMTLMLEGLHQGLGQRVNRPVLVNWATVIISCSIVFTGSWMVNVIAGTPEVFRSVILGYVFGALFSVTYVLGLSRKRSAI